jgi:Tol biopolymer transport system component
VKILDFGLSKVAAPKSTDKTSAPTTPLETDPGIVMGTVGYMSPEQARGASVESRSDIFSLGAVLYEMLSGKRPFSGGSAIETMSAILKEDPANLPENVPPALDRIVRRCLEKSPDERFESARDLAFALESFSGSITRQRAVIGARSRKPLLIAAACLASIALAAAGFYAGQMKHSESTVRFQALTFRRGNVLTANFANDGKTIIYSANWDGKPSELFSTQTSSPESRPLGIKNAFPVSISRTGEIALILTSDFRIGETAGTLARVPLSGGTPREILDDVFWADWSPDGSQLAAVRGASSGQVVEYPIGKKVYETLGFIAAMRVSPKGDMVALVDAPLSGDWSATLVVVSALGEKKTVLPGKWTALSGLSWSPDGSEVWFSGSADSNSSYKLYGLDTRGHLRRIADLPGWYVLTDSAPDGSLLLIQQLNSNLALFHRGAGEEADLYWHDTTAVRDLSSDGGQLLFNEGGLTTTGDFRTYVRKTDGSAAVSIGDGMAMALSPDGKWAMVNPNVDVAQPAQLVALPLRAGAPHPLTSDSIRHIAGRWLPDGERIVFIGAEPGHQLRYYVQDSLNAKPRPISEENVPFSRLADDIVVSPDGKSVVGLTRQGMEILAVDGSGAHSISGIKPGTSPIQWCNDNSLLVYRAGEIPARVMRVKLGTGEQRLWKQLAPRQLTAVYEIEPIRFLPDCETYAYTAAYQPDVLYLFSGFR